VAEPPRGDPAQERWHRLNERLRTAWIAGAEEE
jgi:hypothetical protein